MASDRREGVGCGHEQAVLEQCLILASLVSACGGSRSGGPAPGPAKPAAAEPGAPATPGHAAEGGETAPPAAAGTAQSPTAAGLPDTAAGRQLAWVLAAMHKGAAALDDATLEAHFAPSFLAKVPASQLRLVLAQLDQAGPFTVKDIGKASTPVHLVAAIEGKGTLRASIEVDPSSNRITGLLFSAGTGMGPRPSSWGEVNKRLGALSGHAQYLAAELKNGKCVPLHQLDPGREQAIGSAFKLYVLLGLADRVAAGKAHWDDSIAVKDAWKSLPSGVTQNVPGGTKVTLQALAERMISISDNTAADHLLHTVGRKQVEQAVRESGHTRPRLDVPFLTTRELFLLKLSKSPAEVATYLKMGPAARRRFLEHTLAPRALPALSTITDWTKPRHITDLEWFASSTDLCSVMAALHARSQKPALAPLSHILSINPGIPDTSHMWKYIGFKGGSEPGVMNLTWLLESKDARWYVLSMTVNDPDRPVNESAILGIAAGARDLLPPHP